MKVTGSTKTRSRLYSLIPLFLIWISPHLTAINLPIEVAYGASIHGASETVTVNCSNSGINANRLRFRAHNLRYEKQAAVRVNNGSWIDLFDANPNVTITGSAASYGGIAGGQHTMDIVVTLPNSGAGSVRAGNNTIQFRMNSIYNQASPYWAPWYSESDRGTSAFRILSLSITPANNNSSVITSPFSDIAPGTGPDNNGSWIAPNNGASNTLGSNKWRQKNILKEYPGGPSITASCASCHTQDGSDLRYFGFSNKSIFERSRFHGLNVNDSKAITRYIRNRNKKPTQQAWGRPWNPPYQPGPMMGTRSANDWAAGAGLQWVLNRDQDMLPYLFPAGYQTQAQVDAAIDAKVNGSLGLTRANVHKQYNIPIALQFPDWNMWLPRIYPGDIFNNFESGALFQEYNQLRNYLTGKSSAYHLANQNRKDTLISRLGLFQRAMNSYVGNNDIREQLKPALINEAQSKGYSREDLIRSIILWKNLKFFEVMREFELEDIADELWGPGVGEERAWLQVAQSPFDNAQHLLADNFRYFNGQEPLAGFYASTAWYELQLILNPGARHPRAAGHSHPIDWAGYQSLHIYRLSDESGIMHPLRWFKTFIKFIQVKQNGTLGLNGWHLEGGDPSSAFAHLNADTRIPAEVDSYAPGLWKRIINAMLKEFVEAMEHPLFEGKNPNVWPRETGHFAYTLAAKDFIPSPWTHSDKYGKRADQFGSGFWRLCGDLEALGVNQNRLNALRNWCQKMWPGPSHSPLDWSQAGNGRIVNAGLKYEGNNKFVAAEGGGGGALKANRNVMEGGGSLRNPQNQLGPVIPGLEKKRDAVGQRVDTGGCPNNIKN